MQKMEREGQQDDNNRLDRLIIQTLAILGGLAGLLIAASQLLASLGGVSLHPTSPVVGVRWTWPQALHSCY